MHLASSHTNRVSTTHTYDTLNWLSTVVDNRLTGSNATTTYGYDTANNLTSANYPNNVQSVITYDPLNRITGLATQNSGYLYQRGPTGNLIQGTELSGRSATWNFDGIYRLTGESVSNDPANKNGSVSYNLDPVGNRSSETSSLAGLDPGSFTYNTDDELSGETYDSDATPPARAARASSTTRRTT